MLPHLSEYERDGNNKKIFLRSGFSPERTLPTGGYPMSTFQIFPVSTSRKKTTILALQAKKEQNEPISMLTAYDYPTAVIMDNGGIDAILVGDSLGMVVLGYENTLSVTMDDMLHHCKAVSRGAKGALLIGDMPFMSYQVSVEDAVRNAGMFLAVGGMDCVKLEGGRERENAIRAITAAGIPVMGHIGLTPQSIRQLGGYRAQGKTANAGQRLLQDALILQEAGCFSLVLEAVPGQLAEHITSKLSIPTIGIGAGQGCNGQVLVSHDMLGLFDRFTPKFVKKYADLQTEMKNAVANYIKDVQVHQFPSNEHTIQMDQDEWYAYLQQHEKNNLLLSINQGKLS